MRDGFLSRRPRHDLDDTPCFARPAVRREPEPLPATRLDRLIVYVAPEWGLARIVARRDANRVRRQLAECYARPLAAPRRPELLRYLLLRRWRTWRVRVARFAGDARKGLSRW